MTLIETLPNESSIFQKQTTKAKKNLLWLGIISITMLFAGLTSAYIVRQGEGKWVEFSMPELFLVSTVLIVLSSVSIQWSVIAAKRNQIQNIKISLLITTLLGIGFVIFQYLSWKELIENGIFFVGSVKDITGEYQYVPSGKEKASEISGIANVAGSFLYVITGLHVVHLVGGLISLFVVFSRSLFGKYSSKNYLGISQCAVYWHFLDCLWVYLYLFLIYIG